MLATAHVSPALEHLVTSLGVSIDVSAKNIRDSGPKLSRFLEVTNDGFPRLCPPGLQRLAKGVDELGESRDLGGRVLSVLSKRHYLIGLRLGVALCKEVFLGIYTGDLGQGLGKDLSSKPSALSQRLTERSVLLDHGVDIGTHVLGSTLQRRLEELAAHTGVNNRVPVHKADSACGKSLRKLVHCRRGLSRSRAGCSCKVSNTLDCVD